MQSYAGWTSGQLVEVAGQEEDGFPDSWSEAIIIKVTAKEVHVQYTEVRRHSSNQADQVLHVKPSALLQAVALFLWISTTCGPDKSACHVFERPYKRTPLKPVCSSSRRMAFHCKRSSLSPRPGCDQLSRQLCALQASSRRPR